MSIEFKIREVILEDLDQLFLMLIDLVQHEGISNRFKLTRQRLEDELFSQNADWHALVAADLTNQIVGFCLYSFANINRAFNLTPMIQIDDLYISPAYRRKGVGNELIKKLAQIAEANNIARINVWCIKDNENGQRFYQKLGAEKLDFIDIFKIEIDKIK